jgi:hypothetical protein
MFRNTYLENGLWRGWLKNGQALEISWPRKWSHNWPGLALQVLIHSNDADQGNRLLNIAAGPFQAFIPMGIDRRSFTVGDEPKWGFSACREFGFRISWGQWSKHWDWAFRKQRLTWEYEHADGSWRDMRASWRSERTPKTERHSYTYKLKSGQSQIVTASISRERTMMSRRYLHRIGWPKEQIESIDVSFSGEVGERAGSWKGGCIGCGYTAQPGETPLQTLRRMERDRKFP